MADGVSPKPKGRPRGRSFKKGKSGNPAGRRVGSRNKPTSAAAALLEGESEALTRKAVELALSGDPNAMRLCLERPAASGRSSSSWRRSRAPRISPFLTKGVTAALASGAVTPGEAGRIADVVDSFVRAIETRGFERRLLQAEECLARRAEVQIRPADHHNF